MKHALKYAGIAGLGAAAIFAAMPAWAQAAAAAETSPIPVASVNKGDTAWMLTSSLLVLMMSVPGLALFYGDLVRTNLMLSVLAQLLMIVCILAVIWVTYSYTEALTSGTGANTRFFGGFSKSFLLGLDSTKTVSTFSNGVYIP